VLYDDGAVACDDESITPDDVDAVERILLDHLPAGAD
jgi:hypothetical protein